MIKMRNQQEIAVPLDKAGTITQSTTVSIKSFLAPFAGYIKSIYLKFGTADANATPDQIDIKINGTSIFTGTLATFPQNSQVPTSGTLTTSPTAVSEGDVITVFPSVINGAPANLVGYMVFSKRPVASTELNTAPLSADFDTVD